MNYLIKLEDAQSVDQQFIWVNPDAVATISQYKENHLGWSIITLNNGYVVTAKEKCNEVAKLIDTALWDRIG